MKNQHRSEPIIKVSETYLTLPSGKQIALDALKTFSPNREFWDLWHDRKLEVKRAGVFVEKNDTGEYRGVVRDASQGFSYSPSDLHRYWTEKARQRAEQHNCVPVSIARADLRLSGSQFPCLCRGTYEVVVTICRNETFQLRLKCENCGAKTPGAITWNDLGSEIVICAIAYALQHQECTERSARASLFDELKNHNWI